MNLTSSFNSERFLFFPHIQKTGGLQLYSSIISHFGRDNCILVGSKCTGADYSASEFQHQHINFSAFKVLMGHITLGEALRNSNFKSFLANSNALCFSIIRHPISRIISLYNFIVRWRSHPLSDHVFKLGFNNFALSMPPNTQISFFNIPFELVREFSTLNSPDIKLYLFATENISTGLLPFLSRHFQIDFEISSKNDSLVGSFDNTGIFISQERPYLTLDQLSGTMIYYLASSHSHDILVYESLLRDPLFPLEYRLLAGMINV
jgi:hypothetical protein